MGETEGLPTPRCGQEHWQMEDCGKHHDHFGLLGTEAGTLGLPSDGPWNIVETDRIQYDSLFQKASCSGPPRGPQDQSPL